MPTIPYPSNIRQPIWGSGKDVNAKILKNEFGDGYVERAADGLNHIKETWNITWKNLTTAEKQGIQAFLRERGGWQAFSWTPPQETNKKYTCSTFKFTPTEAGFWDGSAVWEQVFDAL